MKSRSVASTTAAAVFCLWTYIVSISVDAFQIERLPNTLARPSRQQHVAVSMIKGNSNINNKNGNNDEDFMRWAKQSRSASFSDNKVELLRPLGLILNQDEQGNVYVETVAPKGNAARSGKVKEGDIVTMCSATFGDDMWSCRGVGLTRVLAAIRLRSGATVSLVFESPGSYKVKKADTVKQLQAREAAAAAAQQKKDALLQELERDEVKLKKGKGFFGLF